jgi:methylenetetrahydrofolate reductase (NADPH)
MIGFMQSLHSSDPGTLMSSQPLPRPDLSLAQRLAAGHFVITAEVVPPVSCNPDDVVAKALPLRGFADAVNVTDGAGAHAHMSATAAAALLIAAGIEPILQLTCRDRNRIALQGELMGAAALGVRNVLLLRGDDPTVGDQPEAKPVFDLDSRALTETARAIRNGMLPNGTAVAGAAPFFIGAADVPIDPPPGWQPDTLNAKVAAGAQFVQTQFCMDTAIVRRYAACLAEAGLAGRVFLLVGVNPLRSAKSAAWMRRHLFGTIIPDAMVARLEQAEDAAAEGLKICVETIEELSLIPGVAGVHIMAPGNAAAMPEVIVSARRSVKTAAKAG